MVNAILGNGNASTLYVEGFVKKQRLEILIDTGSSYKMINATLVKHLHLPSRSDRSYRVEVGGVAPL